MATTTRSENAAEAVRVLVVDPSRIAAEFVADALEFADPALSVQTSHDAAAALGHLDDNAFDCVVCEYDLDDTDGLAFLDDVSDAAPDVRGVIHTMDDDPAIAEGAWERGAAYAQKGHDVERYDVIARHIVGRGEDIEM